MGPQLKLKSTESFLILFGLMSMSTVTSLILATGGSSAHAAPALTIKTKQTLDDFYDDLDTTELLTNTASNFEKGNNEKNGEDNGAQQNDDKIEEVRLLYLNLESRLRSIFDVPEYEGKQQLVCKNGQIKRLLLGLGHSICVTSDTEFVGHQRNNGNGPRQRRPSTG